MQRVSRSADIPLNITLEQMQKVLSLMHYVQDFKRIGEPVPFLMPNQHDHSRQSRIATAGTCTSDIARWATLPSLEVATAGYHSLAPEISPLGSNSTTIGGCTAGYQSACIRCINQSPLDIESKRKR
jgi:hypothetical protein